MASRRFRNRVWLAPCVVVAVLLGAATTAAADQNGVWTPIGPRAATIFALERHPGNPSIVYAGMYFGGIYRSQDGGVTWAPLPSAFSMSTAFGIAIDPVTFAIYVATYDEGIQKSTDGGATWLKLPMPTSSPIQAVAVDPVNPQVVLAATYEGVLRSSDAGLTWHDTTGDPHGATSFLFDPSTAGRARLGTGGDGVFVSNDGGASWIPETSGMGASVIIRLDLDSTAPGAVLASTSAGVYRLAPGATTWQDITFDLTVPTVGQTLRNPATGDLLAATDGGVFRLDAANPTQWSVWTTVGSRHLLIDPTGTYVHVASTTGTLQITGDGGQSFYPSDYGIQNRFIEALTTVNVSGQTVIYASTDHDVVYTAESFRNALELPWAGGSDLRGGVFTVAPHPTQSGTLFSGTEGFGVWKTTDYGATWTSSSHGIVPAGVLSLHQSSVGARTLYAGTTYGIFASADNGRSWTPNIDTTPRPVSAVLADPVRDRVGYYGTAAGEVFRTFDAGKSFNRVWEGVGHGIQRLAAAPWGDIYAVNTAGELYSSDDLGAHFYRRATDIPYRILSVAVDSELPWVSYIGTVFGGVYKSQSNAIEWTQTNTGMDVPIVFALAIDPVQSSTVYAGSLNAVYKSVNGGASWQKYDDGLSPGSVTDLVVDQADPQTVYATVTDQGFARSTDGGHHWTMVQAGPSLPGSAPIAVSHAEPAVVFLGTQGAGVFRSADRGLTWAASVDGLTVFIKDIAIVQSNPQVMYAASLVDGVFRTTDGGANWTRMGLVGRFVYSLLIDPQSPQTLYASTPTGPARSTDGGATWVDLSQRLPYVFAVAADPADRATVYAGGGGELYRSRDSGRTWTLASGGLPRLNVMALAVDPFAHAVYAGVSQDGIYRSQDDGSSWQRTSTDGIGNSSVSSLAIGCAAGEVYAATSGDGLFKTVNGGGSWTRIGAEFTSNYVSSVQVDPRDCDVVFASLLSETGGGAAIYVSRNEGVTWTPAASGIDSATVFGLAIDQQDSSHLAAAAATGVFTSTDGGLTWHLTNSGLDDQTVRHLFVDGDVIYAGTAGQGIYKSTNGGTSWTLAPSPFGGLFITGFAAGAGSGNVYAASAGNGVLYTGTGPGFDGGTEAAFAQAVFHQLVVDAQNTTTLYAATGGQGVLKSVDGGISWRSASSGIAYPFILSLVIDPVQPQTLYAGSTGGGVFVSDDGAATWHPLNQGLFHKRLASLAIDVNNHLIIYAGTEGGGVFRLHR